MPLTFLPSHFCHTRLHLGFSANLRIWQVSACKMEPQRGIILMKPPTQPPAAHLFLTDPMTTGSLFWCEVLTPIGPFFRKYVLCLEFWAKLRIWQIPACKMKASSTCILECGTPSWDCSHFYHYLLYKDDCKCTNFISILKEIEVMLCHVTCVACLLHPMLRIDDKHIFKIQCLHGFFHHITQSFGLLLPQYILCM